MNYFTKCVLLAVASDILANRVILPTCKKIKESKKGTYVIVDGKRYKAVVLDVERA